MSQKTRSTLWLMILMLLSAGIAGTGYAQGSDPTDDEVNAIAKQLYCPVCENIPLDACGTPACEQWRGIIRDKLADGWTEDQIKDYFVNQYGDRVLAEPPRRGFNWLVYLIPVIAFAAGVVLLFLGFKKWREAARDTRPGRIADKETSPLNADDEYIKKVEKDLQVRSRRSK